MATKIRRSFTDEFKREAVSLLVSSGRPLTQVARELGIQPSMLRHWRDDRQAKGTATWPAGSAPFGWHIGGACRDPAPGEGAGTRTEIERGI